MRVERKQFHVQRTAGLGWDVNNPTHKTTRRQQKLRRRQFNQLLRQSATDNHDHNKLYFLNRVICFRICYLKGKKERKGKWTCIAPIVSTTTTKRSDVDHTELPANTPHLNSFTCTHRNLPLVQESYIWSDVSPVDVAFRWKSDWHAVVFRDEQVPGLRSDSPTFRFQRPSFNLINVEPLQHWSRSLCKRPPQVAHGSIELVLLRAEANYAPHCGALSNIRWLPDPVSSLCRWRWARVAANRCSKGTRKIKIKIKHNSTCGVADAEILKRGGGRQCISLVIINRKCTQRSIGAFYTEKTDYWATQGRPPPFSSLPIWIRHCTCVSVCCFCMCVMTFSF